jgi:hypothetical protein
MIVFDARFWYFCEWTGCSNLFYYVVDDDDDDECAQVSNPQVTMMSIHTYYYCSATTN